jgi:hypothetical protein
MQTLRPLDTNYHQRLLAAMSNRRVTSVSDIMDRLEFTARNPPSDLDDFIRDIFQFRLHRWLKGDGHPDAIRGGIVPEKDFLQNVGNPLIRACLLLKSISDCDILPLDPSIRFTVILIIP